MSKTIELLKEYCTRGEVYRSEIFQVIVDDDDYEIVSKRPWQIINGYAVGKPARQDEVGPLPIIPMHRLIAKADKGLAVHHINGNRLDNRKTNLQTMTTSEHMRLHQRVKKKRHKPAALSLEQRQEIHELSKLHTFAYLAEQFGVTPTRISKIAHNGPLVTRGGRKKKTADA